MDLPSLTHLFATTYNPDPNIRKAAELEIRKIAGQEGLVAALLRIIATNGVETATRQACAVWLKNRVHTCYDMDVSEIRSDRTPIPQSDCEALKSSLLPLLAASTTRSISIQLASALKDVISRDFPDKWPGLLPKINTLLASSDIREVVAGCLAALELTKAFESRRKVLPQLLPELLPTLVNIAGQSLSSPPAGASQEIPIILHYILKAYMKSTLLQLSAHQMSSESLVPWGRLLFQVVNLQIPRDAENEDEDSRERSEWWKAKKWAYAILGRLYRRFGDPSQLPSTLQEEYGTFAQSFITTFAPEIFKVYMHQVELYVSGQVWLSKKCQYHIFSFFSDCIKPKSTWHLVKPHFELLVSSFVFPQMSFTPAKQELWDTDPVDFVRQAVDDFAYFNTPLAAATSFLFQLVRSRTKTTFMPILGFINTVLRSNPEPPQRYGALNMIAALGPFIMRHPEVKDNMEQFLTQHVYPSFSSPHPYLRAVACEVIGTMEKTGVKWSSEENLNTHFSAIAAALNDPELPVKVHAILALTQMVVSHDSIRIAVAPQVGKVVQDLLKLSDETELDSLNSSMKTIVAYYQDELLPVAVDLTIRLCTTYKRLATEVASKSEGDPQDIDIDAVLDGDSSEDKEIAAMGVAQTIGTVVSAVDTSLEILAQVQEVVIPVIVFTLEKQLMDLFDTMYDLVDSLTFKLRRISPSMWQVFELTYNLLQSHALTWMEEMMPALDNFLSYGTDMFKARQDYRNMVLEVYTKCLGSSQLGESDFINGCKLADSILLNLRGCVDDFLQPIITTALSHIDSAQTSHFRLACLEVLVNGVLYNPAVALHVMESYSPGMARVFFNKWFAGINAENGLPRVYDKKLTIIALCTLMEMDPAGIPESLKEGWPGIVAGILKVFKDLPKAIEARKSLEEAYEDESDDEGSDDGQYLNLNDEEEDVWDDESAYMELLAKEGARLRERNEKRDAGEGASDSSSESEEIEEELGFFSPLDSIDPYITFQRALTAFQMKNAQSYQIATTSLDMEQQTLLMELMRRATEASSGGQPSA